MVQATAIVALVVAPAATVTLRGFSPSTAQFDARSPSATVWLPEATPGIETVAPTAIGPTTPPSSWSWYPSGSDGVPVDVVVTSSVPTVAAQATSKRTLAVALAVTSTVALVPAPAVQLPASPASATVCCPVASSSACRVALTAMGSAAAPSMLMV